jgi:hypothetical protein
LRLVRTGLFFSGPVFPHSKYGKDRLRSGLSKKGNKNWTGPDLQSLVSQLEAA